MHDAKFCELFRIYKYGRRHIFWHFDDEEAGHIAFLKNEEKFSECGRICRLRKEE